MLEASQPLAGGRGAQRRHHRIFVHIESDAGGIAASRELSANRLESSLSSGFGTDPDPDPDFDFDFDLLSV